MITSGMKCRWYAYARWFAAAPLGERRKVSRARRCHLRKIGRLSPVLGAQIDELELPLRWARYIAHGRPSEQLGRAELAARWRRGELRPEDRPRL